MNANNTIGFGIGLLAGAIIGGAVALLYAPSSGKDTRRFIKKKAEEAVDIVKEEAGDVVGTIKDAASEASRKGQAAVKALKN